MKMNCKSRYWQTKINEKSIPLTTFGRPQGHYEWIVMSFGLNNTSHIFQRRMDNIFEYLNHYATAWFSNSKSRTQDDIFMKSWVLLHGFHWLNFQIHRFVLYLWQPSAWSIPHTQGPGKGRTLKGEDLYYIYLKRIIGFRFNYYIVGIVIYLLKLYPKTKKLRLMYLCYLWIKYFHLLWDISI